MPISLYRRRIAAMDHMERVMFGAIEALAQLAETQDACKTGRARRVGDYAAGVGTALGLPGHTVRGLRVMGQLIVDGLTKGTETVWAPPVLKYPFFVFRLLPRAVWRKVSERG